jgi:hypothetical protein
MAPSFHGLFNLVRNHPRKLLLGGAVCYYATDSLIARWRCVSLCV